MRTGLLMAAVAALMLGTSPGSAQSLGERFERIFGPPVSQDGAAPAPRQQRAQALSRRNSPAPEPRNVPLPQERPGGAETASEEQVDTPAAQADEGEDAASAQRAAAENPEADATAAPQREPEGPSSELAEEPAPGDVEPKAEDASPEAPDIVPTPEPADRAVSEDEADVDAAPGDEDDEAATVLETETRESEPAEAEDGTDDAGAGETANENTDAADGPAPTPAYVSPEKARTVPEPAAPEVEPAGVTPDASVEAAAAVGDAMECEAELRARGAEFTVGPSIAEGACGVLRPIRLTRFSAGTAMAPETQMLCRTALALDIWVSEALVPAARKHLDEEAPTTLRHASTYVCRDRASENGLSEHGKGSAVDIGSLEWEERGPIVVEAQEAGSPEDKFLADIRRAACGPFRTVLGPGTDADHAEHFHFDIAARSNGSLYCR